MAGNDIGPRIGMEGEAEFRRQLQEINQSLKTMQSEGKALTATMEKETDAEKKNAAQKDLLKRQIDAQKESLDRIKTALEFSAKAYGENDTRTLKWEKSMHEATASLAKMENQLDDTENEVEDVGDSMEEAEKSTASWADVMKGTLLADALKTGLKVLQDSIKAVAQAMKDAVIEGAAYGDEILTLAATTNLSAKTLQEFKYMEDMIDVSLDTVAGSLTKLTRNMNTAREGTGAAAEAFDQLGVDVVDSNGNLRSAEDVFNDVIDALGRVGNETERDALAMTVFGKSAKDLNPLIKAGSDELNRLKQEAHDSGYVLSNTSVKALGKTQDALDRLNKKTEAVKNQFAVGLAPGVQKAADTMTKAFDNPRVQRGLQLAAEGLGKVLATVAELTGNAIPAFLGLINGGDVQLRTFTDAELELARITEEAAEEQQALNDAYADAAGTIGAETQRTQDLWRELQTLADETGNVKDADADRAAFILNQLNEALGTEYTMTGNQIEQYQMMREEIEKLIVAKQANALLEANQEAYTTAIKNQGEAIDTLAQDYMNYTNALEEVDRLQKEFNAIDWTGPMDPGDMAGPINTALQEAKDHAEALKKVYDDAAKTHEGNLKTIQQYEAAQAAFLSGNYESAVKILTSQIELYSQDVEEMGAKIAEKEALIDALETYYAESGDRTVAKRIEEEKEILEEMQKDYAAAEKTAKATEGRITGDQKQNTGKRLSETRNMFSQSNASLGGYEAAFKFAQQSMTRVQGQELQQQILNASAAFTQQAQNASAGGENVGRNFGEGVSRGIRSMIQDIIAAAMAAVEQARDAANQYIGGSGGSGGPGSGDINYNTTKSVFGDISTDPIQGTTSTSTHETIDIGGVTINNYEGQMQNVDQLADKVANRLNQQIIREKKARGMA